MQASQQLNKPKIFRRASFQQRLTAAFICLAVAALFAVLWLAADGKVNLSRWLGPCGFRQRYGLPCPTCGITSSAFAFVQGKVFESFYVQPAGALFCCLLVITAFFAFLTAVFGIYFRFLERFFAEIKVRYIILAVIVIIAAGWAVTLARALAASG